jgi:hypothetical protein
MRHTMFEDATVASCSVGRGGKAFLLGPDPCSYIEDQLQGSATLVTEIRYAEKFPLWRTMRRRGQEAIWSNAEFISVVIVITIGYLAHNE